MFNIACLNPIAAVGTNQLGDNYQIVEDAGKAEGILVRSAVMHDMPISENLLAAARAGAGVNNIPLDKMAEAGVVVFNTPGANANGVKEQVVCALLLASRDLIGGAQWAADHAEDPDIAKAGEKAKKAFAGTEIKGKTLGIIGLGAIGALVGQAAAGLGMTVIGYDPYLSEEAAAGLDPAVKVVKTAEEIYKASDYITLHVPAVPSTIGMIDQKAVDCMKDGVVLVNFARDTLADNNVMRQALSEGKIRKYLVDFPTPETVKLPNTLVFPHLGASTAESEDNCAVMAVNELKEYLEKGNIIHSVNYPALKLSEKKGAQRVLILCRNDETTKKAAAEVLYAAGAAKNEVIEAERGAYACMAADLNEALTETAAASLGSAEGIYRVRLI